MLFEQFSLVPNIARSRYWISILKAEKESLEQLKEKKKVGYAALGVMEQHLSKNELFIGNQYSIADISLYAYTHIAEEGDFDLSQYRYIKEWFKRIENQKNHVKIKHQRFLNQY